MKKPFKDTKLAKFIDKARPIVGGALDAIGEITGKESIEKLGEIISGKADDDGQAKALLAEFNDKRAEFELEFAKIDLEVLKQELADTQNARSREVQFIQATGKRDWLMGVVVAVTLVMYIAAFAFLAYGPTILPEKKDLFNMAVGQVFTFAGMTFSYYLGTTRSSRMKDEIIKRNGSTN